MNTDFRDREKEMKLHGRGAAGGVHMGRIHQLLPSGAQVEHSGSSTQDAIKLLPYNTELQSNLFRKYTHACLGDR